MTAQELQHIKDIEGTAGFRVMKFEIEQKLKKLESVKGIKKDGLVAEQALARQLAVEVLEEFLSDISLTIKPQGEIRKTYE